MLKQLLEKANRKCEMSWKAYAYDPEKDNKLVDQSKKFDNIEDANRWKADYAKKHNKHIIEIVAEAVRVQTSFGSGKKKSRQYLY